MIELLNVNKKFKENVIFSNLDVTFPSGKIIMIKGPNGSGKSVLLRLIVGYSKPDSGTIKADQTVIGKDADFIPNAGVSINAPEFISEYTGIENMEYLAKIRKVASKQDILLYASKLGMEDEMFKKYKTYSLGMKQKLRLIQALMDKPQYLILDEPFDALDDSGSKLVMKMLGEYCTEDTTLIITNHISEFDSFADDIYKIENKNLRKL